jgi:uncharacterized membrane protein
MSAPPRLRDYTSIPFEIFIAVFTILPFFLLLVVNRELRKEFGGTIPGKPIDGRHVYGGFVYFNPSDSALFSRKYFFNFANKWPWVFVTCIIAYPLLVFCPG